MINLFKYFIYEDYNDSIIENSKLTLSNSEFLIILKQNELDEILKKNYQFDYYKTDQINEGLKKQAKAFCIFVDKNLVHITWLALNNESKKFVDDRPMKIDWSNTGVWGLAYTHPNFRKNGFYQNTHKQIQKFLLNKNIKFNRFTIKKRNVPSISAMSKFKPKNIAKGYSFHLLKFKFRLSIPINIK